jgi:hypothetical protein
MRGRHTLWVVSFPARSGHVDVADASQHTGRRFSGKLLAIAYLRW